LAPGQHVDWTQAPPPGATDIDDLLSAAEKLAGGKPDVIAVDMPLAFTNITSRRASDTAISTQFGAAGAAVHSPNAQRPGATRISFVLSWSREIIRSQSPRRFRHVVPL
jgi:predicted RNase H-like nuclease